MEHVLAVLVLVRMRVAERLIRLVLWALGVRMETESGWGVQVGYTGTIYDFESALDHVRFTRELAAERKRIRYPWRRFRVPREEWRGYGWRPFLGMPELVADQPVEHPARPRRRRRSKETYGLGIKWHDEENMWEILSPSGDVLLSGEGFPSQEDYDAARDINAA